MILSTYQQFLTEASEQVVTALAVETVASAFDAVLNMPEGADEMEMETPPRIALLMNARRALGAEGLRNRAKGYQVLLTAISAALAAVIQDSPNVETRAELLRAFHTVTACCYAPKE